MIVILDESLNLEIHTNLRSGLFFFFSLFVARHCLWIVGNGTTLSNSKSVWQKVVKDARDRGCYFEASDDKDLSNAVVKAIIELDDVENLVKMESLHISRPSLSFR